MTTPKTTFAGFALIAALCAGVMLGLTAQAGAGVSEGAAAYKRGDYAVALREWRPLAERGHADAQYNLGGMYVHGAGVPQDYVQAHMWLNLAASRFQACASRPRGKPLRCGEDRDQAVKNRDIVAKRMTPVQISEAQKLAREWRPK